MSAAPDDASLITTGPLYRLWRHCGLLAAPRRIAVVILVTWVPLVLLALAAPAAGVPLLQDVEVYVRFLLTLPLLILAEGAVDKRIRWALQQFADRELVPSAQQPRFAAAVASSVRWSSAPAVEAGLLLFVYTVGHLLWRQNVALGQATWYAVPSPGELHYTPAGLWYAFVAIPAFHFLLLRWYLRLFLWFQLLWRISRLDLRLDAAHPDRAAGIGFVGDSAYAFSTILFAQGAQLSSLIANRIFHDGETLGAFKVDIVGLVLLVLVLFLAPYAVFTPGLARASWQGLADYGTLAARYTQEFRQKWIAGGVAPDEPFVGSADIQSLADIGNSYQPVRDMRLLPFNLQVVVFLAIATLAPMLPLTLTALPVDKIVDGLFQLLL